MRINLLDTSFVTLAVISLLNLNGAVLMAVGIPQAGSPFLLLASLILVWKLGATPLPAAGTALLATIAGYLVFALFFSVTETGARAFGRYPVAYTISILMLWAAMLYMLRAGRRGESDRVIRLIRNLLLIGTVTVLASPVLYSVFVYVPPSGSSRFGGFFANPNEAGLIACAAMVFLLHDPLRSRLLQAAAFVLIVLAVVLTFSKTAWLVLPIVLALHLLQRSRRNPFLLLALLGAVPLVAMIDLVEMLEWVLDNPYFELTLTQERRLKPILYVLSAEANAGAALTGRDFLWQYGLEEIAKNPFVGGGIGTFHHLEGGIFEAGVWQGVHNTYLMVLGEAGLFAFLLFVFATLLVARDVLFRAAHPVALPLAIIVFLNLQVNHNILSSRYFIVLLGVLVCLPRHAAAPHAPPRAAREGLPS